MALFTLPSNFHMKKNPTESPEIVCPSDLHRGHGSQEAEGQCFSNELHKFQGGEAQPRNTSFLGLSGMEHSERLKEASSALVSQHPTLCPSLEL